MKNVLKNNSGSLTIEVLLSIAIATIFSLAIGSLVSANSRLIASSQHEATATALAKEALEQVYAVKNQNWSNLSALPEGYLLVRKQGNDFLLVADEASPPGEKIDVFVRKIIISSATRNAVGKISMTGLADSEARRVDVIIAWTENGAPRSLKLTSYLTHWK